MHCAPPQLLVPPPQPQTPFTHAAPLLHGCPQPPQLLASVMVSTHVPPHGTALPLQVHAPFWQVPTPQECSQVPQFSGSPLLSTHAAPQTLAGLQAHCPATQAVRGSAQVARFVHLAVAVVVLAVASLGRAGIRRCVVVVAVVAAAYRRRVAVAVAVQGVEQAQLAGQIAADIRLAWVRAQRTRAVGVCGACGRWDATLRKRAELPGRARGGPGGGPDGVRAAQRTARVDRAVEPVVARGGRAGRAAAARAPARRAPAVGARTLSAPRSSRTRQGT